MRSVLVREQKPYTRDEILAFFDGDGHLTREFGEDLGFLTIGLFFLAFDIVPLGMS